MKVLILLAIVVCSTVAHPLLEGFGGINNAQQSSIAEAGHLGTAIADGSAVAGLDGLGGLNNARQNSQASAGLGGVAVASGNAVAGRD